jgi:hypothetical protein
VTVGDECAEGTMGGRAGLLGLLQRWLLRLPMRLPLRLCRICRRQGVLSGRGIMQAMLVFEALLDVGELLIRSYCT